MYRGTTPTLQLMLLTDDIDLSDVKGIWVTLKSPCVEMTFTGDEVDIDTVEKKAYIRMTQEQTLSLGFGKAKVQARILMQDGMAYATEVAEVDVQDVLMGGVLEVEDDTPEGPDGPGTDTPEGGDGPADGRPEGGGGEEVPEGPVGEL